MNLFRFLIFLSVFLLLNIYLYIRGRQALPDKALLQTIYTGLFLLLAISIFIAIFAGSKLPLWLSLVFEQAGGYWMILFFFFVSSAILGDLLRIANHFFHIFPVWVNANYPQAKLLYFCTIMIIIGTMSLVGFIRFSNPVIVELDLTGNIEPAGDHELTIVVASDLHLGNVIRKDRLAKWVNLINRQKPDIVLLAGDIFDHSYRAVESQQMDQNLAGLQAKYGVFAIPGNHDYYTGIDKVMDYLGNSGMTVLRDSAIIVADRVIIIGRDDLTNNSRKTLASLVSGLNSVLPKIVLDHQPHTLNESVEHKIDLHLSGHTHNGQIFPFNRIVSLIYDLGYGYRKTGHTHLYVSAGLGLWGAPIRIGTRSEIVRIRMKGGTNKNK
jgi:predicted MPP superfamily phosphohydrolase